MAKQTSIEQDGTILIPSNAMFKWSWKTVTS
jgi:hypothetical protein